MQKYILKMNIALNRGIQDSGLAKPPLVATKGHRQNTD